MHGTIELLLLNAKDNSSAMKPVCCPPLSMLHLQYQTRVLTVAVLTRWTKEMLACGLYTQSKSPSASRPHIVRKPPPDAPKDVDIKDCGLRVCGITGVPMTSSRSRSRPPPTAPTNSPSFPDTPITGSRTGSACIMPTPCAPAPLASC